MQVQITLPGPFNRLVCAQRLCVHLIQREGVMKYFDYKFPTVIMEIFIKFFSTGGGEGVNVMCNICERACIRAVDNRWNSHLF